MKQQEQDLHNELVTFVARFTNLLELQVADIRTSMENTVTEIFNTIDQISVMTSKKKDEAELMIEQTYINPTADTSLLVSSIQNAVDSIMENELANSEGTANESQSGETEILLKNRLKRLKVHFAPTLDGLDHLDNEMKNLLITIMGSLSADDVIAQRTEHVVNSMHGLQVMLSYLLIDFNRRAAASQVLVFEKDLHQFVWDQYTMEEEKQRFSQLFPNFKDLGSKAS